MLYRKLSLAILVTAAACSPAAGTTVVPGGGTASPLLSPGTAPVTLVVTIPPKAKSAILHPRYVSPSTASIDYSIDGDKATVVKLSSTNPLCKYTATGSLQCSISMAAKVGKVTFSFTTYDAHGKALSANTNVVATVSAKKKNVLAVVLGGLASSFEFSTTNLSTQVFGTPASGFTIYGKTPVNFSIVPLDSDGNVIVGPGAPAAAMKTAPAGMTLKTPAPGSNTWSLTSTYSSTNPLTPFSSSVTVSASPVPNSGGKLLSKTIPLKLYQPWIYVADAGGSIQAFDEQGHAKTLGGSFANVTSPGYVIFDPHNSFLYVTNETVGTVTAYDVEGNQQILASPITGIGFPANVAFDPTNDWLYVTDYANGAIDVYDEQGHSQSTSLAPSPFANLSQPVGIALDPVTGFLYVANRGSAYSYMLVFNALGTTQSLSAGAFPGLTGGATSVGFDAHNGRLYVGNGGYLATYDALGNSYVPGPCFTGTGVSAGAYDPYDGFVYVSSSTGIATCDESGAATSAPAQTTLSNYGVAIVP
jgi:DNA-binding beta-propeller fold protein YncE